ncbi:MAG: hypothetical protein R3326_08010, partial [Gemmatimonadota bacterium]|nr:hypothetical protein [Gemmatimonadota bacterium]
GARPRARGRPRPRPAPPPLRGPGRPRGPPRGAPPRPAAGIGLGSTVAELRAAYGERVDLYPADGPFPDGFGVSIGRGEGFHGSLTGLDDGDRVTFLSAGDACGE